MKINRDNGKALKDIIIDEEENIYQKLARVTSKAVDINLGKTTLADLLDGYTKSITLQQKIDKAIEYIKNNSYSNIEFNFLTRENHVECHFNNKADPRDLLEILGGTDETN